MAGHLGRMAEDRCALKMLIGKPTKSKPLGRLRLKWEANIRMGLKKIGVNTSNWVDSAQYRDS